MSIQGNKVIGLKVLATENGKFIDKVSDLIFDSKNNKVIALLIDPGGWLKDAKIIKFEDIRSIGQDAVMVDSEAVIRKAGEVSQKVSNIAKDDVYLTKSKVMTEDGKELGSVTDISFDENSGELVELIVSQGLENLRSGKKTVKVEDVTSVGEDVIIVKSYTEFSFDQQAQDQGLGRKMSDASQKARDTFEEVKTKAQEKATDAKDMWNSKETKDKANMAREKSRDFLDKVEDNLSEAGQKVSSKVQDLLESGQRKTEDMKERAIEDRKKEILGKYLTVNILSLNDEIIAKRGELITNEVITLAEQNDQLDKVLTNSSNEPVN